MTKLWKPIAAVVLLALVALLVARLLPDRPAPQDGLTNATVDRLERQVDSLRLEVERRDSAIVAYEGRIAGLDASLVAIARRNETLLQNLNGQRRTIENVSNDSLARDLNRILRTGPAVRLRPAPGVP